MATIAERVGIAEDTIDALQAFRTSGNQQLQQSQLLRMQPLRSHDANSNHQSGVTSFSVTAQSSAAATIAANLSSLGLRPLLLLTASDSHAMSFEITERMWQQYEKTAYTTTLLLATHPAYNQQSRSFYPLTADVAVYAAAVVVIKNSDFYTIDESKQKQTIAVITMLVAAADDALTADQAQLVCDVAADHEHRAVVVPVTSLAAARILQQAALKRNQIDAMVFIVSSNDKHLLASVQQWLLLQEQKTTASTIG